MKSRKRTTRHIARLKRRLGIKEGQAVEPEVFEAFEEAVEKLLIERYRENENLIRSLEMSSLEVQDYVNKTKNQELWKMQTSKMAAIGEMASSISHEINNPMQIIRLAADSLLLRDEETNPLSEIQKKQIGRITKTVDRVSKIIMSLKKLSHDSNEGVDEVVSIHEVLQEVMVLSEQKYRNANISLNICSASEDYRVRGNFQQLSIVIMNLLSNAYDQLLEQSEERKWVRLNLQEDSGELVIQVCDGGGPIPEEIRSRIFESFFTTKEVGKGTGIGLSICKKIVSNFGGRIWLDAQLDHTCFVIQLKLVN